MSHPTQPQIQNQDWFPQHEWLSRHDSFLARKSAGPIDLLFLGDSITEGWLGPGEADWLQHYLPRNAANFGISGDETQHLLWRLTHGEIDGISPRVIVLLIGTNNLGNSAHSARDTLAGIHLVIQTLRQKLPTSRILLLALFPRDSQPHTPLRQAINQINQSLRSLDDSAHIRFLDLTTQFLSPDQTLSPDLMPDYLHLSPLAYHRWQIAMEPLLQELLQEKPNPTTCKATHQA